MDARPEVATNESAETMKANAGNAALRMKYPPGKAILSGHRPIGRWMIADGSIDRSIEPQRADGIETGGTQRGEGAGNQRDGQQQDSGAGEAGEIRRCDSHQL
jgi:hypothetical protein